MTNDNRIKNNPKDVVLKKIFLILIIMKLFLLIKLKLKIQLLFKEKK